MQSNPPDFTVPRAIPPRGAQSALDRASARARPDTRPAPQEHTAAVRPAVREDLPDRMIRLQSEGTLLPDPGRFAEPLPAILPEMSMGLDPHYADLGPYYDSRGAAHQLRGITEQGLSDRRRTRSVLAMQAGDRTWLYPAWQFTGAGTVYPALTPVLRALRPLDRWTAGVWLVSEHPDLGGRSPRAVLREGDASGRVAALAAADVATQVA